MAMNASACSSGRRHGGGWIGLDQETEENEEEMREEKQSMREEPGEKQGEQEQGQNGRKRERGEFQEWRTRGDATNEARISKRHRRERI